MGNLSENLNKYKSDYRLIFKAVNKEIQNAIKNFNSRDEFLDYFNNILPSEIKAEFNKIKSERENYNCAGCGACCRFAVSEFSPDELKIKAQSQDSFASQFIQTFVPYASLDVAREVFPEYVDMLEKSTDGVFYIYHCPKVTVDNRCPDYENRPQICRDFPDFNGVFLPKSCAFMPWKLNSLPVWLKINAQIELLEFYRQKIKDLK